MKNSLMLAAPLAMLAAIAGCGPRPVVGGTPGRLTAGAAALGEVQVTVHRLDGDAWRPIGFAETAADGSFALVTEGAAGPLELPPGEYRVTLESVGAPIDIPADYRDPKTSPLVATWPSADSILRLEASIPVAP